MLIYRPDGIGDAVLFSGALKYVRRRWPRAHIVLAAKPGVRDLLGQCPHITGAVSLLRFEPWRSFRNLSFPGVWRIRKVLRSRFARRLLVGPYDSVILPLSAPTEETIETVRLVRSPEKWGFSGDHIGYDTLDDEGNEPTAVFTRHVPVRIEHRWLHELTFTARFVAALGFDNPDVTPELWLTDEDRRWAEQRIPHPGCLGCFIGAGHSARKWPADRWESLVRTQAAFSEIALFGSKEDAPLATRLSRTASQCGLRLFDLTGRTTVRRMAACIGRCAAVVSNDSSGLHLAVAQDVPTVGIMGGYHYGRFYPWGNPARHRVAKVEMPCYHCNDHCVYGDWRCVSHVPVSDVLRELILAVSGEKHGCDERRP